MISGKDLGLQRRSLSLSKSKWAASNHGGLPLDIHMFPQHEKLSSKSTNSLDLLDSDSSPTLCCLKFQYCGLSLGRILNLNHDDYDF